MKSLKTVEPAPEEPARKVEEEEEEAQPAPAGVPGHGRLINQHSRGR